MQIQKLEASVSDLKEWIWEKDYEGVGKIFSRKV
jgi:hypothetical protein